MGPVKGVVDQGARGLSMIASILGLEGERKMAGEDVKKLVEGIVDPAGTFYRFSLPVSLFGRRRVE